MDRINTNLLFTRRTQTLLELSCQWG